jgi:hypothetical protein
MARTFDGSGDFIKTSVGACALTGAFTVVCVIRRNSNSTSYHNLLTAQTGALTGSQYGLEIESNGDGNNLQIQSGNTGFQASSFTVTTTDGWCLVAGGKASGTATPRMHKYVYSSNTWTHQNAGGTLGNPSSVSGGVLAFGTWENDLDDYDGDLAVAAIFDRNLTDVEVEQLAHTLQGWYAAGPVGMWIFDQSAIGQTVIDNTGNGANQSSITGTAVATSSAPGPGYGFPIDVGTAPTSGGTQQDITVSGIASDETFGTARLDLNITGTGIASAEAFGTARLDLNVTATGIASGEAFGTPTLTPGAVTLSPTGIASAEAFGTPAVGLAVALTGITTGEAFGTPVISLSVAPGGIVSAEAFGTPRIDLEVGTSGIASSEAFGTPSVGLSVAPGGIGSGEAFGTPTLAPGQVTIGPGGIATGEAFGDPVITQGLLIAPSAIVSAEAFGTATLTSGPVTITVAGIASAEAFGSASLAGSVDVAPSSIGSGEAFGGATVTVGPATISPTGVASAEAFGDPVITGGAVMGQEVWPEPIMSAEVFGRPVMAILAAPVCGCVSAPEGLEQFGLPAVTILA